MVSALEKSAAKRAVRVAISGLPTRVTSNSSLTGVIKKGKETVSESNLRQNVPETTKQYHPKSFCWVPRCKTDCVCLYCCTFFSKRGGCH